MCELQLLGHVQILNVRERDRRIARPDALVQAAFQPPEIVVRFRAERLSNRAARALVPEIPVERHRDAPRQHAQRLLHERRGVKLLESAAETAFYRILAELANHVVAEDLYGVVRHDVLPPNRNDAAAPQDAVSLGERTRAIDPVERLRADDDVKAFVRERERFGFALDERSAREPL